MNYGEVQSIAKHTLCFIKNVIKPGMKLMEVRTLCEEKMLESERIFYDKIKTI